ncbi:adenylosuccinate lyase [Kribbella sp. CA-293567]|uniref:adenylosuccinate lyase n=1 Tax=Kribbella sp. CA-293567 TaxID=3002436 RepID=UPI0022DDA2E1|nr:adenylosuccinate lyase [Kribbella sp. CA-293567]WBQ04452.1 adenylosuccinate lyase [Kribbella sp. CA-293567]
MHDRYTSGEMARVWSDEAKLARWREVELAVLGARVEAGEISTDILTAAEVIPAPSPREVAEVEADVRHDVVAFIYAWTANMDDAAAREVHRDLTSSDIVDTAQALALTAASDLILSATRRLLLALTGLAIAHRSTIYLARTHGQAAAPDVFGHRLADFAFAVDRARRRFRSAVEEIGVANISGPVGTGVGIGAEVPEFVAARLGLRTAAVSTQVVFRDGIAAWLCALAVMAGACEAIATEVRLGQQEAILEIFEPAGERQQGSSAMPHKQNPIASENVCGLARVVRGYVSPVLEDVALWQHRDISHSSVERIVLPDAAAVTERLLITTSRIVEGLVVDADAMRKNLLLAGSKAVSSRMLSTLLISGIDRRTATAQVAARVAAERSPNGSSELDGAIAEVLESSSLAKVFDDVLNLAERTRQLRE